MVRAKFRVEKVSRMVSGGEVLLVPVTGGSVENEKFFKYTPYGNMMIGTINEEALKQFIPGEECIINFSFPEDLKNQERE